MRIISGTAGRRQIRVPHSLTRPSTDRLREALFSILADRVQGARVLDLFAGSGALGLECLSRGAQSCLFVDDSREAQQVIRRNLGELGLAGGRVMAGDVLRFLKAAQGEYDLIFADPPYCKNSGDVDYIERLFGCEGLANSLSVEGLLVIEDAAANQRGEQEGWQLVEQRRYGGSGILFYQRQGSR